MKAPLSWLCDYVDIDIPVEKLQEKLSRTVGDGKLADEENGHGIGLANINRRIKLFYSDEYGIKIKKTYRAL